MSSSDIVCAIDRPHTALIHNILEKRIAAPGVAGGVTSNGEFVTAPPVCDNIRVGPFIASVFPSQVVSPTSLSFFIVHILVLLLGIYRQPRG